MKSADRVLCGFLRAVLLRMKAMGKNKTVLAQRLNVSRPYVTKLLSGDVNISFGSACRLAKAIEMDFCPKLRAVHNCETKECSK